MRKTANFEMMDKIAIYFNGDDEIANAVEFHKEYIMQETLADKVERVAETGLEVQDLNGHDTGMKVERI